MSINVTCKVCGRKIVNLSTSHLCEDGSYVGPTCKNKTSKNLPSMDSLLLSRDEASAIVKKLRSGTEGMGTKEAMVIHAEGWKKERNFPWEYYNGLVFEYPAHPDAIASIKIEDLVKFEPLICADDKKKLGYNTISNDHISRAVHCFLKLFRDITLSKEQMDLFNKQLGIKLLGVAPSEQHDEKHEDFSNFVITSTKSPYPERAVMVSISSNGGVKFRCLNLVGDGCEVSVKSDGVGVWPSNTRRTDSCTSFKQITAFIVTVFMADKPENQASFKTFYQDWDALKSLSDPGDYFEFQGTGDSDESY